MSACLMNSPQLWRRTVALRERRCKHQRADKLGMANRNLQGDARAVAEAEQISVRNVQVLKQTGNVVGRILERERRIAIPSAAVHFVVDVDTVHERPSRSRLVSSWWSAVALKWSPGSGVSSGEHRDKVSGRPLWLARPGHPRSPT